MKCPYCHSLQLSTVNSRPTNSDTQTWRRKVCANCNEIFTTHEIIDLSHLVVIKKSGKKEKFSHAKLFSGIYGASIGYKGPNREEVVDRITSEVEKKILFLKKKELASEEIAKVVLTELKERQIGTFMRFLAYNKNISSESQLKRELAKYIHQRFQRLTLLE